jgi:hypothetical protein
MPKAMRGITTNEIEIVYEKHNACEEICIRFKRNLLDISVSDLNLLHLRLHFFHHHLELYLTNSEVLLCQSVFRKNLFSNSLLLLLHHREDYRTLIRIHFEILSYSLLHRNLLLYHDFSSHQHHSM